MRRFVLIGVLAAVAGVFVIVYADQLRHACCHFYGADSRAAGIRAGRRATALGEGRSTTRRTRQKTSRTAFTSATPTCTRRIRPMPG